MVSQWLHNHCLSGVKVIVVSDSTTPSCKSLSAGRTYASMFVRVHVLDYANYIFKPSIIVQQSATLCSGTWKSIDQTMMDREKPSPHPQTVDI